MIKLKDLLKESYAWERKLQDLVKRNKKGAHYGIGKNSFNLLSDMWEALSDYEENN